MAYKDETGSKWILLSSQIIDGIGAASHGLIATIVTDIIMKGTGKFGSAFGIVQCYWQMGNALGNVVFGYVANGSYAMAIISAGITGVCGLLPIARLRLKTVATADERHRPDQY